MKYLPFKLFPILFTLIILSSNIFSQWAISSGPSGMNITEFYQKGTSLFAGSSSHGVFRSTNHGVSWVAANAGIENRSVFTITFDGVYLFAGTDNGTYRSSNNGTTWTAANSGIEGKFVYSFLNSGGYLFAGTIAFGVFKSNDHGTTWTDANGGALGSSSIYAMTYSSPNILAMADNNIFYSNDNGNSWFYPVTSPFVFSTTPAFIVQGDSVLLNAGYNVFRSFDSGETWGSPILVTDNINITGFIKIKNKIYAGGGPGFNGGDPAIYWTKNFGATWHLITSTGLRIGSRYNNHFYKSGGNFLMSFDELGVAYSSDKGFNWQYTLSGFPPASNIDNALFSLGDSLLCGTHSDGLYRSTNDGTTWTKIGTASPFDTLSNGILFSVLKKGNIILAGACGYGLYRSADDGVTWTHITNGLPIDAGTNFLCINSLTQAASNLVIATDLGVYYSTDDGLSWNATSISGSGYDGMGVAANGTVVCAAVNRTTGANQIYRSTNSGVTWTSVFSSFTDDFVCMASDGVGHFYTGTFANNYLSSNNGVSWGSFGPGIPAGSGAFTIAVQDNNVFVGNSTGIYFSNNSGGSFTAKNEGLSPDPNRSVQGLAISNTYVFAGLFQNAVWKRPLADFGLIPKISSESVQSIPEDLSETDLTIFPNPVTDASILTYAVTKPSKVSILIYNMEGKIMTPLWSSNLEAGIYNYNINNIGLSPGNYIISVFEDGTSQSIEFTVAK